MADKVLYNPDLFTKVFTYLSEKELKRVAHAFRNMLHYEQCRVQTHTLLYGQVQSGKTGKIMDYIQQFMSTQLKVLIVQNSTIMMVQYIKTMKQLGIKYVEIKTKTNQTSSKAYNNESVLITIHNKFRIKALNKYMATNKLNTAPYTLILDESDQYLKTIQKRTVYEKASHVLHVTATPFVYLKQKEFKLDKVVCLKPKENYVGINDVNIKEICIPVGDLNDSAMDLARTYISPIIEDEFLTVPTGFMLINYFSIIKHMKSAGIHLSSLHQNVPFVVLSNESYLIVNGEVKQVKIKNMQTFIDGFREYPHIVFIANRLSTRGINYTDSTYTRTITHQVSKPNNNFSNFIQKCRIFGLRNQPNFVKPNIYVVCKTTQHNYTTRLRKKMEELMPKLTEENDETKEEPPEPKVNTVKYLMNLCKQNNLKRYSHLRKQELIDLLKQNNLLL